MKKAVSLVLGLAVLVFTAMAGGAGCGVLFRETPLPAAPIAAISSPDAEAANPVVIIKYTPNFVLLKSRHFLVINISIENRGYETFNTAPERFYVMVSNARFNFDPALSDLRTLDVPDRGKILGKLSFEVPSGTVSSKAGYSLGYTGDRSYNVQWFEISR